MRKKQKLQNGFTLVELLVVVAIVSILAAAALPNFYRFSVKSKRSESTVGLSQIYKSEISFFGDAGYFTPSFYQLGITMGGSPSSTNGNCIEGVGIACGNFYSFHIPFAGQGGFEILAQGWPDILAGEDLLVILYP